MRNERKELADALDELWKAIGEEWGLYKVLDALVLFLNWTNKIAKSLMKLFNA